MIHDIEISEGDVDHYVGTQTNVYIVLDLCVNADEQVHIV